MVGVYTPKCNLGARVDRTKVDLKQILEDIAKENFGG